MRQAAIALARTIAYVEIIDLIPNGNVSASQLAKAIAEQFHFQKFPQTLEEHDTSRDDGVVFAQGMAGTRVIQKFTIWSNLMTVETRTSTEESKAILEEILLWAAQKFGLSYAPGAIKRFAYVSSVSFYSDFQLLDANPALTKLAAKTSDALSDIWHEPIKYESLGLSVGHDPMSRKFGIAQFQITHRANTKFSDNKYFSEAPLPTSLHWELLEEFERDIALAGEATRA